MVVAPDGSIYWVERWKREQRLEGPPAPDRAGRHRHDRGRRRRQSRRERHARVRGQARQRPEGVALGPDGSIYAALGLEKKVIRIAPDGSTYRFAGKGVANERGTIEPGRPANESFIDAPFSVAAANDGTVYIRSLGTTSARPRR